jgi:hypothetical protein
MAERAFEILTNAIIRPFNVPSGKSVTQHMAVKFSGADDDIEVAAATTDDAIGIALEDGSAGDTGVRVALFGSGIVKVKVGSAGTATRGSFAKFATAGCTNATVGGGTTKVVFWGQFLQSGVAADIVSLNIGLATPGVGS